MQTLEEQVKQIQNKNINKMPKNITMEQAVRRDDVQSILKALPSYKDNKLERFAKGAISGLQGMADVVPAIEIYGQQADLAIGGYFKTKPEVIQRKALNLATSYRNLQARQQERYKYSNPEDVNSFAYGLGQGAFNYGLMLLGGGLVGGTAKAVGATAAKQIAAKTVTGLSANVLLENVEQQSERMPLDKLGKIDVNKITPEWARDSAIGTTAYLGVSTLLEKGFGFGKQVKMWETPIKTSNRAIKISSPVIKSAAKSALSEGMTEGLQSLTSTGILLAEGKIDVSQLPERLQDAWKEAVIGGLLGGTAGTAVAINQAHNVKTMLTEQVSKVVTDPEECEKIVDAIYDSGTAEMTNVISKELELSSELNTKHGSIYDSMQGAIYDAINNSGAFTDVSEAEIAQYVSETSKMFADQVLAEANKRGVLIDDVLKASDIKFENGKIYMKAGKEIIAENTVTEENPEALKGRVEMNVNEQGQEVKPSTQQAAELYDMADTEKPLPKMSDNYLKDLKTYSYNLYRETNADGAISLIDASTMNSLGEVYLSNAKDLAKGQGENQGIILEFSSNGIQGQVNTHKPNWKFAYENNQAEFIAKNNDKSKFLDNLKSVTITDKEVLKTSKGKRLQRILDSNEFIKNKNGDGTVTYFKNNAENPVKMDKNGQTKLFQLKNTPKQPKIFKGAYDVSAKAIELFKDADYSTLPHELAHYWLDNMWSYYRSGKASEAYSNNFQGVLDWLGVKEGQINLTRAQQEKFARGYEKYLLNGYAPSGLIQGAFDDYDKWLQKVYNDARELKVKLTPDAIEFFDTMTTGELPEYDVPETQAEIREKNIEQMNKDIETARKFVVEKQAEYNNFDGGNVITKDTVPVTTEGEKKQSRAYTNQASILGIADELGYNKADIAEQNKLATDFVKNNLDEARQIVNGEKEAPSNILKNAIYNAYLKEMLAIGDNEAYVNALRNQSLELTRAGQEIASQRGAIENIFDSGYWIRRIENLKKTKLATDKFGAFTEEGTEKALSKMNDLIKNRVDSVMDDFMNATPEEQKKIAEKLSKDIAAEFNQKPDDTILYQTMKEPSEVRTRTNAYNYLYRAVNGALGIELSNQQANEVIAKTEAIQKAIETTRNRNGNPSALFFKNLSEMENYAQSIMPSPPLAILTSIIGRGNMLTSLKTPALNIESNIINFANEFIARRMAFGAWNLAVDKTAIQEYLDYSREVYNTSGYQVSSMPELDVTQKLYGEQVSSQGKGAINQWGRFVEQTIFKYSLGYPDLFFKDRAFIDAVNLLATKEAKGDSEKATKIFKDACLIEPKTAKGKEIRQIAINEGLITTYQNDSKLAKTSIALRNVLNQLNFKGFKLGESLEAFVKTPANVLALSIDGAFGGITGGVKMLTNWNTVAHDIQTGQLTDTTRSAIRSIARNGIGILSAILLASMIDDDDFIPDYSLLSPKERELVKMKGGVFNSIKIGDKYVSLDYLSTFGMALAGVLNARRSKNKFLGYLGGAGIQSSKFPVFGVFKEVLENVDKFQKSTKDKDFSEVVEWDKSIDFATSRLIPSIVTDIAKMTDEYERETVNAVDRLKSKLPVLRQELPAKYSYGTGAPIETQNPVSQLFAGARIKDAVSTPVIREIDKLMQEGNSITLSKVTRSGDLSKLSDSQKIEVERKFAQRYAQSIDGLMQTNHYNSLDDSEKAGVINKLRKNIVSDLKVEYGLEAPKKPKTRKRRRRKRSN